jgi:hypothetical protein
MSNPLLGSLFGTLISMALFIDRFMRMYLSFEYKTSIGLTTVCACCVSVCDYFSGPFGVLSLSCDDLLFQQAAQEYSFSACSDFVSTLSFASFVCKESVGAN